MKKLISKINHLEEILNMGLLSQNEVSQEIREIYCQILDKYSEGSKEFERLSSQLVEVQNLAFDIYEIDAWY